jgi:hypothetical protein
MHDLAVSWPNVDWWLAVNPGLPIEAYLPSWFLSQMGRGDVRLPGRTLGARARIEHATSLHTRKAAAAAAQQPSVAQPAQPVTAFDPLRGSRRVTPLPVRRPIEPETVIEPEPVLDSDPVLERIRPPFDRRMVIDGETVPDHEIAPVPPPRRLLDAPPGMPIASPPLPPAPPLSPPHASPAPPLSPPLASPAPPLSPPHASPAPPLSPPHASPAPPLSPPHASPPPLIPPASTPPASYPTLPQPPNLPQLPPLIPHRTQPPVMPPPPPSAPGPPPAETYDIFTPEPLTRRDLPPEPVPDAAAQTDDLRSPADGDADARHAIAFEPANTVEESLLNAAEEGSTDRFLSTLLLAKVLVPDWLGESVDPINWRTEDIGGVPHLIVFTSKERMLERLGEDAIGSWIKFTRLIRSWPSSNLSFVVNPDTPVGAALPGGEVLALASWAAELGLGDEPEPEPASVPESPPRPVPEVRAQGPVMMQKPISPEQLSYYLERNYDRASGFVYRAAELDHLTTPEQLYYALGLSYAGSSFKPDAAEVYVLRWAAHRGNLYRIPYGGQHEAAMRAMEGWVIERPPFRGNGFAPSETSDVVAEFKVDSARLPHGAQLWRMDREGNERLIALLDSDGPRWRRVDQP